MYITISFFNSWDNGNSEIDFDFANVLFSLNQKRRVMGSLGDKVTCFRHLAPCRNRPVLAAPLRMVTGWEQSRQSLPGREAVVDAGGSH